MLYLALLIKEAIPLKESMSMHGKVQTKIA